MFRHSTVAGIAAAALLATSVLVGTSGSFASGTVAEGSPVEAVIPVSTVAQAPSIVLPDTAVVKATEPACARKVKVVYAGYGEGAQACGAQAAR